MRDLAGALGAGPARRAHEPAVALADAPGLGPRAHAGYPAFAPCRHRPTPGAHRINALCPPGAPGRALPVCGRSPPGPRGCCPTGGRRARLLAHLHRALLTASVPYAPFVRHLREAPGAPCSEDPASLRDADLDTWHAALVRRPDALTCGPIHGDYPLSGRRPRPSGQGMNAASPAGEHAMCYTF